MAIVILSFFISCSRWDDNIFGCKVDLVQAEKSIHIDGSQVSFTDEPVMQIIGLFTVDSFLVVKAKVKDCADQMFVFSLRDNKYTGKSFIAKGRGPSELLNPICCGRIGGRPDSNPMYIFDLSLCESYAFDVEASMNSGKTELSKICSLPEGALYAYPFRDSLHFVKAPEPDCFGGQILNPDGSMVGKVALYDDLPGQMYFDTLSSADAFFSGTDIMAMGMSMLPQVNFINVSTGERHTIAINKKYSEWEKLLYKQGYTRTMCYGAAIPAGSLVIALYYGAPLVDWATGNALGRLHVFNAEGRFLYAISLDEALKNIAYDGNSGMLYGVDMEDRIYQYDMSGII